MLDLSKSYEFFKPDKIKVHIIGCGSVGSTIAENLARCGVQNFILWDFDVVEPHNIANQMFTSSDIGRLKTEALSDILKSINDDISITIKSGWNKEPLNGYVFLCVDNIEIRREFVEKNYNNLNIKAVFDVRTLLEGAQHYAADWKDLKMKKDLLGTMQFSHDEAKEETPVSACGITLGVATTVRMISAIAVNNYINFIKGNGIKKFILLDAFNFMLEAF